MASPSLPINVDSSYADDATDPSIKTHQQHHDVLHALANLQDTTTGAPLSLLANNQTGTTYTLVLADASKVVELNNASAITVTIPPNLSVAFPVGTTIELWQQGAGQVSVTPGAGVTLLSPGTKLKIALQYGGATLRKRATDTWALEGNLSA